MCTRSVAPGVVVAPAGVVTPVNVVTPVDIVTPVDVGSSKSGFPDHGNASDT